MARRRMRLKPSEREALFDVARDGPFTRTRVSETLGLTITELNRILRHDKKAQEAWEEAQQCACDLVAHRYHELSFAAEGEGERRHALTEYRDQALGVPEAAQQGQRPSVEVVVQLPAALSRQQYERVIEHEPAAVAAK